MELTNFTKLSIKYNYFDNKPVEMEIHIFSDVNPKAFRAWVYFRHKYSDETIKTCFLMVKSRTAPLKTIILPWLKLMWVLVAARICKYLKNVFGNLTEKWFLWSDSKIVITWLRGSPNNWKPFVSNHVAEIKASCSSEMWNHCVRKQNPADLMTRVIHASALIVSKLWWHGPHWMNMPTENLPKTEHFHPKKNLLELRKKVVLTVRQGSYRLW